VGKSVVNDRGSYVGVQNGGCTGCLKFKTGVS
ncbi:MAG: hypothetical protein ACI90E_001090, partial [Yoonia sp.]